MSGGALNFGFLKAYRYKGLKCPSVGKVLYFASKCMFSYSYTLGPK
jgi:hypothetical protein